MVVQYKPPSSARRLHARPTCQLGTHEEPAIQTPSIIYATAAGTQHDMPGHSECAARIPAILSALELSQLTAGYRPLQVTNCNMSSTVTCNQESMVAHFVPSSFQHNS